MEKLDTSDPVNRVIAEVLCEEGVCEDPDNLWDAFYCPPNKADCVISNENVVIPLTQAHMTGDMMDEPMLSRAQGHARRLQGRSADIKNKVLLALLPILGK